MRHICAVFATFVQFLSPMASEDPVVVAANASKGFETDDWSEAATRLVRAQMVLSGVTYKQLAALMVARGFDETERKLISKVTRGTFSLTFFLQVMTSLGRSNVSFAGLLPSGKVAPILGSGVDVVALQPTASTADDLNRVELGPKSGNRLTRTDAVQPLRAESKRRRQPLVVDPATAAVQGRQKAMVSEERIAAIMAKQHEIMYGTKKKKPS